MFSRRKPKPSQGSGYNLPQFPIADIPIDFDPNIGIDAGNDDDSNSDVEAELAEILAQSGKANKPKPKPKANLPPNELNKLIEDSLRDVGSENEDDGDAENDPELLGELQGIVGNEVNNDCSPLESNSADHEEEQETFLPTSDLSMVDVIKNRIEMYKLAETNAKEAGDSAKARRFNRGLKTLNDLLKQATLGKSINADDIPPEVRVKLPASDKIIESNNSECKNPESPKETCTPAPVPPIAGQEQAKFEEKDTNLETASSNPLVQEMRLRQQEYKAAALQSKRAGDNTMALQFLKVFKQFDVVMKMIEDGQEVDLSDMPPPPEQFKQFMENMLASNSENVAESKSTSAESLVTKSESVKEPAKTNETNMLEALQQRLCKYKSVEESAKNEGNAGKARRFGRIVKQYEEAIKAYEAGRTVAYEELPVPPGFGPLPIETTNVATSPKVDAASSQPTITTSSSMPESPKQVDLTVRTSGNQQKNNLAEQQMKVLLDRQKEFKIAAIEAKKAGEIDQAKEYLKIYKGFDALLNAASNGLPVDLNTLPVPPSQKENLEASFAIVIAEECDPNDDIADIGLRIEEQLAKQLMMCKNTRDHHKNMGDIAGMNRFENLALTVQKDLDLVRYSKRKNFALPKFHYEQRNFNIVHCNTELTDNELEIVVVRGIKYNVPNPKDVDTYVKIECPLPNDEIFKAKTNLVKDTDSPDYDQHFTVDIVRTSRQFQRIFRRHGVKFEVYSRGGFLRSDILIGTVNVKLQPLETKCDIHDTFDLVEGRKKISGKLEIKLRIRNPILTKQIEHINEKWLVIDPYTSEK